MANSADLMNKKSFTDSKALIILLGALTAFDPLSIDMYLPAFSDLQTAFGTSFSNIELSVSTFFVGMAFGQLFYGPLADRFGRKRPLIAGMILYICASAGLAFASNIESFLALRLLQAFGGCAGMVVTRAIVRDLFDKKRVAEFLSSMALIMGLAPILAPSMGAFVNHFFGWRVIFGSLAVANILCLACIILFLPETNHKRSQSIDVLSTLKAYAGLMSSRKFVGFLIPDAAVRAGMFAYIAGSPFVFIQYFNVPQEYYGWIFGMNGVGLMAASQVNRRLLRRFEPDLILRWSVRFAALAAFFVFAGPFLSSAAVVTLIPIFCFLASLNFIGPNALAGALATQGHQAGTASALYGCLQWSLASGSAFLVSYFHNGTAMPMTGVILGCGLVSALAFQFFIKDFHNIPKLDIPVPSEAEPGS
ncbi:MAG: multidrug effflux MFS transporter [Chitinophagaceae bacterium]|nr:multidrug effflux MFS transporter [Oligoflexus sp.]